ncbi:MAG: helix-hairpin-helix domain-containing protein [Desulfobacterales bacterium]|jgi:competence protein ComEA|nr:helix-hairpin-helix domain-containing protein [Desulfobacterales bacterium]
MRKLQPRILLAIFVVLIFGFFAASWAEDSPKININTALADELVQLKGIGKKKAAGIIDFRETNGPFKRPEDLIKVPGIGPKTFEANKHLITVK